MRVYLDSAGLPTAGTGHLLRKADGDFEVGDQITPEQEATWLQRDLQNACAVVDKYCPNLPTDNARDALISFGGFNLGPGVPGIKDGLVWLKSGDHSTIYKLIEAGDWAGAAEQFQHWTRAGNTHPRGLKIRRALERDLFLAPDGPMPDGWLHVHDSEF